MSNTITENEIELYVKEPMWVLYAVDPKLNKRLHIAVGIHSFRITHGKEVAYEGNSLREAVDVYNLIKTIPIEQQPSN